MTKILIEIDTDTQRVVPVEPTEEMVKAWLDNYEGYIQTVYRAMLAAAPQTEPVDVAQIEQETAEACAKLLEKGNFLSKESLVALAANGASKAIRSGAWKEYL